MEKTHSDMLPQNLLAFNLKRDAIVLKFKAPKELIAKYPQFFNRRCSESAVAVTRHGPPPKRAMPRDYIAHERMQPLSVRLKSLVKPIVYPSDFSSIESKKQPRDVLKTNWSNGSILPKAPMRTRTPYAHHNQLFSLAREKETQKRRRKHKSLKKELIIGTKIPLPNRRSDFSFQQDCVQTKEKIEEHYRSADYYEKLRKKSGKRIASLGRYVFTPHLPNKDNKTMKRINLIRGYLKSIKDREGIVQKSIDNH